MINSSSKLAVMEGINIALIENGEDNYKIMTNADFERIRLQDQKTP